MIKPTTAKRRLTSPQGRRLHSLSLQCIDNPKFIDTVSDSDRLALALILNRPEWLPYLTVLEMIRLTAKADLTVYTAVQQEILQDKRAMLWIRNRRTI